tara:strand:- start:637 stop:1836 length:1200 start_codon:yes stop_codon:yes gene_type:complete
MLDKKKILLEITKNKNFSLKVSEPYNSLSLKFINDFSSELRKKNITNYPDLIYLVFWCSKKKLETLKNNFKLQNNIRKGRGLAFHICPSNVPTNFFYSFIFGLLSGNSNIVKIPNEDYPEKKIILDTIKILFKRKKYKNIKNSNFFVAYNPDNKVITEKISSICDCRIIWGGDHTINKIRKIWIPERCIELTFSDRYSISIINIRKLKKISSIDKKILIKNFFYDSYMMNQQACNSPHFIFWIGKFDKKITSMFWNELNKLVKKKYILDEKIAVDKYTNLIKNTVNYKELKNLKMFENYLYVSDLKHSFKQIQNLRGINGTFYQKNLIKINDLEKYISKKCQTVTYYGFELSELKAFISNSNFLGIDRIVPIGKGLEIDLNWDGYDIIGSLSRIVNLEL